MVTEEEACRFLSDPVSYGIASETISAIKTHISIVFLTRNRAFKWKRRVSFYYLDFQTAASREAAYQAEFDLNRRTAPELYIGIRSIRRDDCGLLSFGKTGEIVDWVLEMRRFESNQLLSMMAVDGKLTAPLMENLASVISQLHARAPKNCTYGGLSGVTRICDGNFRELSRSQAILGQSLIETWYAQMKSQLAAHAQELERRRTDGMVRRCHGDLHLANICIFNDKLSIFDCIEFSEELSIIDVLYDLAFLLMDLEFRGLNSLANRVLQKYIAETGDGGTMSLIAMFGSLRASTRAQVAMAQLHAQGGSELREEARRYMVIACRILSEPWLPMDAAATDERS